jgi:hypothetical protein
MAMNRILYLSLSALSLAACGGAATPAVTPASGAAVPAQAKGLPYGPLFETGRTWRYRVMVGISDSETAEDGMRRETHETICKVAEVRQEGEVALSSIECEQMTAPSVDSPIGGAWAADARGLWRLEKMPAAGTAPTFRDYDFVLDPAPKPQREGDEESGVYFTVERRGDLWCSTYEEQLAEGTTRALCFDPARGVVSGSTSFAGTDTPSVELTADLL